MSSRRTELQKAIEVDEFRAPGLLKPESKFIDRKGMMIICFAPLSRFSPPIPLPQDLKHFSLLPSSEGVDDLGAPAMIRQNEESMEEEFKCRYCAIGNWMAGGEYMEHLLHIHGIKGGHLLPLPRGVRSKTVYDSQPSGAEKVVSRKVMARCEQCQKRVNIGSVDGDNVSEEKKWWHHFAEDCEKSQG